MNGFCLLQVENQDHLDAVAIRSTTDSLWAGERWLYRAAIMIVLWPLLPGSL